MVIEKHKLSRYDILRLSLGVHSLYLRLARQVEEELERASSPRGNSTVIRLLRDFSRVPLYPIPDVEARCADPRAWPHTSSSDYYHVGWEMTCQRATLLRPLDSCLATIREKLIPTKAGQGVYSP